MDEHAAGLRDNTHQILVWWSLVILKRR